MIQATAQECSNYSFEIETEDLSLSDQWLIATEDTSFETIQYIYWNGPDYFNEPGRSIITVPLDIKKEGTYTLLLRSKIGEGQSSTDYNDTWVKCSDCTDYYAIRKDGHILYPHGTASSAHLKSPTNIGLTQKPNPSPIPNGSGADGWFKVYSAGSTDWTWSTSTSDNDGHRIQLEFDKPGLYNLEISPRSSKHQIDKFYLFQETKTYTEITTDTNVVIQSAFQKWHKVTMSFNGPETSETDAINPFMDYRLDITFKHSDGHQITIPGYYAACGEGAYNWCDSGNIWRTIFRPDRIGYWTWTASFKEGKDVNINGLGQTSNYLKNLSGEFKIGASDKPSSDFRSPSKGRLQYVGAHYLRHSGTNSDRPNGEWFIKAGADATENTLDYIGFAGTPNKENRQKTWAPHAQDYIPEIAEAYNWGHHSGTNILGMINYLSLQGMNALSFLTYSLSGDDENVFPHLQRVPDALYHTLDKKTQWSAGVHHDRFDCSKLDQWEQLFSMADALGIFLHFKLNEEENECNMDGGALGRERKIYYKELIARYGHHLALNWNIGEENGPPIEPYMSHQQRVNAANYISEIDSYNNHMVVHTRPDKHHEIYKPLTNIPSYTGASVQSSSLKVHKDIVKWVTTSDSTGYKWVVCNDEQGTYQLGVAVDSIYSKKLPSENKHQDNRKEVRHQVLWGTLMAGGAGVEYYYGYESGCSDLNCQDHRTRFYKWNDARHALSFFNMYLQDYLHSMKSADGITLDKTDYVFSDSQNVTVIYLPVGGSIDITSINKSWLIRWYNPRTGIFNGVSQTISKNSTAPSSEDWVAIIGTVDFFKNKKI